MPSQEARPPGWAGAWPNPKMAILGEAWGRDEDMLKQPFVGSSGQELWKMLGEAMPDQAPEAHHRAMGAMKYGPAWVRHRAEWLETCGIAYTNVFNLRPHANDIEQLCCSRKEASASSISLGPLARSKYLQDSYLPQLTRLRAELAVANPPLVVAAGNTACWAMLRATNIGALRGTVAQGTFGPWKVLPTYHPAGVMRQWNWRTIVVADLMKAWREAQFRELRRPTRQILISPTLRECQDWWGGAAGAPMLSVDIETGNRQIKCIGFATSRSHAIVIPFVDLAHASGSYWPTPEAECQAWGIVRAALESPIPKLFQNGVYDLQYIVRMGIRPKGEIHDTMLLHHSLFSELRKGLGFLGSIYTDEASWKLMNRPKADTEKREE